MVVKIVYLDDEPDICDMFRYNFENADTRIWTFTDAADFLVEVGKIAPDLILLDYRLPGTNGDQVASRLDPEVPKVMITGDLEVAPVSKFVRVFHKPFGFDEMQEFITEFVRSVGTPGT